MGPRRNAALLPRVLAEPLLSVIQGQASQAHAAGWFWTYHLKHIKVRPCASRTYDLERYMRAYHSAGVPNFDSKFIKMCLLAALMEVYPANLGCPCKCTLFAVFISINAPHLSLECASTPGGA